ncbi:hypothetical protein ACWGB8_05420 [Kitasatospora sp. NPDC054939]
MTAEARREAAYAVEDLLATLAAAGVCLPSVGVDWISASATGVVLIDLGAAKTDEVVLLTAVLRDGVRARLAAGEEEG